MLEDWKQSGALQLQQCREATEPRSQQTKHFPRRPAKQADKPCTPNSHEAKRPRSSKPKSREAKKHKTTKPKTRHHAKQERKRKTESLAPCSSRSINRSCFCSSAARPFRAAKRTDSSVSFQPDLNAETAVQRARYLQKQLECQHAGPADNSGELPRLSPPEMRNACQHARSKALPL